MAGTTTSQTVIISGISAANPLSLNAASSFATSGTTHLALLGTDDASLAKATSDLQSTFPKLKILSQAVDLTSPESIGVASHHIRSQLSAWDIFIHNAGPHVFSPAGVKVPIRGADEDEWWNIFEVNVRSLHSIARHFFPKMKANATFINVSLANSEAFNGRALGDRSSAEVASALAAVRVVEYLGKESESAGLRAVNILAGSDEDSWSSPQTVELLKWCASAEASAVNGRCLDSRTGVEEHAKTLTQLTDEAPVSRLGLSYIDGR